MLDFNEHTLTFIEPLDIDPCETLYPCPVDEFMLSMIVLKPNDHYKSKQQRSAEILLCTDGSAELRDLGARQTISLQKGASAIVPAAVNGYEMRGSAIIYKASVPLK